MRVKPMNVKNVAKVLKNINTYLNTSKDIRRKIKRKNNTNVLTVVSVTKRKQI